MNKNYAFNQKSTLNKLRIIIEQGVNIYNKNMKTKEDAQ